MYCLISFVIMLMLVYNSSDNGPLKDTYCIYYLYKHLYDINKSDKYIEQYNCKDKIELEIQNILKNMIMRIELHKYISYETSKKSNKKILINQ